MSGLRFARRTGVPLLLLVLASACGDNSSKLSPEILPPSTSPAIHSFVVEPEVISAGGTATLAWRTQDAVSVSIADAHGTVLPLGDADVGRGEVTVQPTESTSYTLTATGPDGAPGPVYRTVSLAVRPGTVDAPTIERFSATPEEVQVGGDVVLAWQTSNATAVTVKDDAGQVIDLDDAPAAAGQVTVRPGRPSTVYSLIAEGLGGRANADATVTVSGLPRVARFFVDPLVPVRVGGAVTLGWETLNANRVVIRQDGAVVVDTTAELSGRREIVLNDNATFAIEASGLGQPATATVVARVGATIRSFTASQRVVRADDPVDLAWEIRDADRAVLEGPAGYSLAITGAQLAAGSATVNVAASGEFVLTAFREDVPVDASLAIEVTAAPRVRSFAVDQAVVTAALDHPETVTVSWTQDGAETCSLFANNGPVDGYQSFDCGGSGSATVQVFGTTTLRLTAFNASGDHSASVGVEGIPPARIPAFAFAPARRLAAGSAVELSWTVRDAAGISMTKNTAPLAIPGALVGSTTDTVATDTTYVLTAVNSLNHPTYAEVAVHVGAPVLLAAVANPSFIGVGQAFTLAWTADGGDVLTVTGPGEAELFRTADPAVVDAGSASLLAPVTAGTYQYVVASTNADGTDSRTVEVVVSDGPMIQSVTASKAQISLGESLTFTWSVSNDAYGNTPALTLTDNYGHSFTEIANENPNNDTLTITPGEEGQHLYTFTASTGGGRVDAVVVLTVEVTVAPVMTSLTATPDMVSTNGGQVVPSVDLTWVSQNAVEVTLWESDAAGVVVPPPFHRVSLVNGDPQSALDSGTFTVRPTVTTWYVARAKNRIGTYVDKKVKVIVDPPSVDSFTATPAELAEGNTVQLEWHTTNATSVRMIPQPILPTTEPFIDASTLPGAATVTLTGDDTVATLNFPAGFTFPFEGVNRTALQVSTNGTAGFNTTNTSSSGYTPTLPNTSAYMNFSLYGCDLDSDNSTPNGTLWYAKSSDAQGDFLVVQWKDWGWYATSYNPSNLNFELILRANGDFEYRYGAMTSVIPDRAAGLGCLIGYQGTTVDKPWGLMVPYQTALAGGLVGKGFAVKTALPPNGAVTLAPIADTTYTLTAVNADASVTEDAAVKVWKIPVITNVDTTPVAPMATQQFKFGWNIANATRMRVLNDAGVAVCGSTNPAAIAAGYCMFTEATPGLKTYTVVAENGPVGAPVITVSQQLQFRVYPYLAVTSLNVGPEFRNANDQVTVEWTTAGAVEIQLWACVPKPLHATCTDITPPNANPTAGSMTYTVTGSTEFWLQAFDVSYVAAEASRTVWVGANQVDLTATKTQLAPGEAVTLDWNITNPYDLMEASGALPFIDLTGTGTVATLSGTASGGRYTINFPAGFTFPWFGSNKTGLKATTSGWITFDMADATTNNYNYTFPTSATYNEVHLAPFWDYLEAVSPAQVLWKQDQTAAGVKYLVVQWKDYELYYDETSSLNFEVVLWENGDIDFRYGTMVGGGSYVDDAQGSGATIGYQNPAQTIGWNLSHNTEFVGGLSNRSWRKRFGTGGSTSTTVTPTESGTYSICTENASQYRACDEVRVVVVKPGDLLFSEAMIAPTADAAEWFELVNLSPDAIDLKGWAFSSGSETYTLPAATPFVVQPGAYAVFARSADPAVNGGLTPAHVYGEALTLDNAADGLSLFMGGTPIDQIAWGPGWTIPANQAIGLSSSVLARNPAVNDVAAAWCPGTVAYGTGTLTGTPGASGNACPAP